MSYTDQTLALLRKMKPGVRVRHYLHGKGTITGPAVYLQVPVEFDTPIDADTSRMYCYPDNLDILP